MRRTDNEYWSFWELAVAWDKSGDANLTLERIYWRLWNAIWDGVFEDKILMIEYSKGLKSENGNFIGGTFNTNGKATSLSSDKIAQLFRNPIAKALGIQSQLLTMTEQCKKVNPQLLILEVDGQIMGHHETFGIHLDDFNTCWLNAGRELPAFLEADIKKTTFSEQDIERSDYPHLKQRKAGRPSHWKPLIKPELDNRIRDDRIEKSIKEQARILQAWFASTHKSLDCPAFSTFENNLAKDACFRKKLETSQEHGNNNQLSEKK